MGVIVRGAVNVTPFNVAEIVTAVDTLTLVVETVKVWLVWPGNTDTPVGTIATVGLLLERNTVAPAGGGGLASVTIPLVVFWPCTVAGLTRTLARLGGGGTGTTSSVAVRVVPL